ncbi:hypothetical protein XBLMG947_4056 [Xanthomonas bromi]|uniref:Uncharacterized protein n=1 Tax=Xanthomonas bromi TaxID=56449 RepID=A0A1C3NSC9_9XANT|nr:hypothetical protein XBLMG947_4056 [Xanthomonas bromi]
MQLTFGDAEGLGKRKQRLQLRPARTRAQRAPCHFLPQSLNCDARSVGASGAVLMPWALRIA